MREWEPGVRWEPNAPDAVMVTGDRYAAVLALDAHFDDADDRCVVLVWKHATAAVMSPPNDEAIDGHRLWARGLDDVLWAGVVDDSEWVAALERENRVHDAHDPAYFATLVHHVLPLKECVVEVVSRGPFRVERVAGRTLEAAFAVLGGAGT